MSSISPIFYEHIFHMKVLFSAFVYLQFVFLFFRQKEIGEKAASKMLVKLARQMCQFHQHVYKKLLHVQILCL